MQVQACGAERDERKGYWYGPWKGYDHARCVLSSIAHQTPTDVWWRPIANGVLPLCSAGPAYHADSHRSSSRSWCPFGKRYPSMNAYVCQDSDVVRASLSKTVRIAVHVLVYLLCVICILITRGTPLAMSVTLAIRHKQLSGQVGSAYIFKAWSKETQADYRTSSITENQARTHSSNGKPCPCCPLLPKAPRRCPYEPRR